MTLQGVEVPVVLLVLGLFVAVRTLFLVRARRTAARRPVVRLLPRPASPVRVVPPARAAGPVARRPRAQARAQADREVREQRAA